MVKKNYYYYYHDDDDDNDNDDDDDDNNNNNNNNIKGSRGMGQVAPLYGLDSALVLSKSGVQ